MYVDIDGPMPQRCLGSGMNVGQSDQRLPCPVCLQDRYVTAKGRIVKHWAPGWQRMDQVFSEIDAIETARQLLLQLPPQISTVGQLWRTRAAAHLAEKIDTDLRGGARRWQGEDQALALVKAAARDLEAAAQALMQAAAEFRGLGHGWQANRTYHAAQAAAAAANALDPQ